VLLLAGVLLLGVACRTPVGVKRVDARTVHRTLTANVLSTGKPSPSATQTLNRSNLAERFGNDPEGTLAELRERYLADPEAADLAALAELAFAHAENGGGGPWFLASAVYAYAFLFPGSGERPPDPFDPRLRLAADLYNRGLTAGLMLEGGDEVDLAPRTLSLPFGELVLESRPGGFLWAGHRLEDFVPVAELEVRGLRDRYRRTGIGAPLAARIGPRDEALPELVYERWIPKRQRVPCTAFVRMPEIRRALAEGRVRGSVELYLAGEHETVPVDGRPVPLEFEPTAVLAFSLTKSRLWDVELAGFRGQTTDLGTASNLVMLRPHERGRIPLVFVHGTASSPARWAEMLNELAADRRLLGRYEAWVFFYNTGNPILYSAMQLRELLQGAVAALDPEGSDPGLRRMVVMGHSQGGLLTKLMAVESGDRFWANVSDVPLSELDLDPETESLLRRAMFFEPVPEVRRLIFIATPHGGSFLAGRRVAGIATRLVTMPVDVARAGADLLPSDPKDRAMRKIQRVPSSIDNMTPGHPFIVTLRETPLDARVSAHSIIAVRGGGPLMSQHDGVVRYESAHVEGVASEKVVVSSHSVQGHPEAIAEVRRILLEHLDAP
jgi:pimeloyl-ACP methyl ester carboxylesterase